MPTLWIAGTTPIDDSIRRRHQKRPIRAGLESAVVTGRVRRLFSQAASGTGPWLLFALLVFALLAPSPAVGDPLQTLAGRMQLFHDGSLRGFAVAELPENGVDTYTEDDFRDLAATGANVVRVSISLRKCDGCDRYEPPDEAAQYVERILERGQRLGFRVIVTLHPTPGFSRSDYWDNPALRADIVRQWGQLARRLRTFPALQAYDLVNEPVIPAAAQVRNPASAWYDLSLAIAREVRSADPETPIMIEPTPWGLPGSFRTMVPLDLPGVVYSFHLYDPHAFTHQGLPGYGQAQAYPGQGWDKQRLAQVLEPARRFAERHRAPMFVGEFSCVRWAPDGSCPRYLADAIALLDAAGWGWTYHCWRCYQGWDAEVPADVPQAQRSGRLPEQRRSDSASAMLLREALSRNARPKAGEAPAVR